MCKQHVESFSSKILMAECASALPHTLHDPHAREESSASCTSRELILVFNLIIANPQKRTGLDKETEGRPRTGLDKELEERQRS